VAKDVGQQTLEVSIEEGEAKLAEIKGKLMQ